MTFSVQIMDVGSELLSAAPAVVPSAFGGGAEVVGAQQSFDFAAIFAALQGTGAQALKDGDVPDPIHVDLTDGLAGRVMAEVIAGGDTLEVLAPRLAVQAVESGLPVAEYSGIEVQLDPAEMEPAVFEFAALSIVGLGGAEPAQAVLPVVFGVRAVSLSDEVVTDEIVLGLPPERAARVLDVIAAPQVPAGLQIAALPGDAMGPIVTATLAPFAQGPSISGAQRQKIDLIGMRGGEASPLWQGGDEEVIPPMAKRAAVAPKAVPSPVSSVLPGVVSGGAPVVSGPAVDAVTVDAIVPSVGGAEVSDVVAKKSAPQNAVQGISIQGAMVEAPVVQATAVQAPVVEGPVAPLADVVPVVTSGIAPVVAGVAFAPLRKDGVTRAAPVAPSVTPDMGSYAGDAALDQSVPAQVGGARAIAQTGVAAREQLHEQSQPLARIGALGQAPARDAEPLSELAPVAAPASGSAGAVASAAVSVSAPAAPLAQSPMAMALLDVRKQGWTKTLVNRAAGVVQAGGVMTLKILPHTLGQITLKLSEGRKGLELRMTAEVASTAAMLRDVQGQIERAFDDAGLSLSAYSAQTGGQGQHRGGGDDAPSGDPLQAGAALSEQADDADGGAATSDPSSLINIIL